MRDRGARQPWMKFYPADWRAEPRLRMSSLSARGLWVDIMTYMHEGEPYGHFLVEGVAPDIIGLAALVSRPVAEVKKAIAELEERRVFSRTEDGVIYSRRMVRDKAKADSDRANGLNGGNPDLVGGVNPPVKPPKKPKVKHPDKAQRPEATCQDIAADDDASVRDPPKSKSAITPEAYEFWERLRVLQRLSPEDLRCVGGPYAAQTMLTKGLKPHIVEHVVEVVMARRAEAPRSVRYFEDAIAVAHAEAERPLPVVKLSDPEVVNVRQASIQPQSDWQRRQDDSRRALDEFRAGIERLDDGGGAGDGADIFVLRDTGDPGPEGVSGGGGGGPGPVSGCRYG